VNAYLERGEQFPYLCADCFEKAVAKDEEERNKAVAEKAELEAAVEAAVAAAGVRPAYRLKTPPIRFVAEWIWNNRDSNILLSGTTGTGKSTSAGVVTRGLIQKENKQVRLYYLADLLDEWRKVRCDHDDPDAIKDIFRKLESVDVLIIDECADKSVNTDSSQEFAYRLLEDVQNGACHAKVWMLGNFYRGSLGDLFGDAEPATRRIREKFTCGRIDLLNKKVIPIFK
jgi:DNA replication protein DnaC